MRTGGPWRGSVDQDEVRCRFATITARFDFEFHFLVFIEAAQTRALDSRDVDENPSRTLPARVRQLWRSQIKSCI